MQTSSFSRIVNLNQFSFNIRVVELHLRCLHIFPIFDDNLLLTN